MKSRPGNEQRRKAASSTIKQWPLADRPREKLYSQGPAALTEAELLAILIRTGIAGTTAVDLAKRLLSEGRTLRDLAKMSVVDFKVHDIGESRAAALVAAFELMRRVPSSDLDSKPVFRSPQDVVTVYGPRLRDLHHEEFWSILLTSSNQLIREIRITTGILNSSLAHPRECFVDAIKEKAAGVIFFHNHPSGNPEPSGEDISLTRQLVEAGKILGIPVHDHIIIADAHYSSFAERGLL
ncbi:MAG: DNA repair protein RadC [bacterium]